MELEPFIQMPDVGAIRHSGKKYDSSDADSSIEDDLKSLFIEFFNELIAGDLLDANVLGAPHLGSFDLVRRTVNADGLALLPNSSEKEATRYVYRAWRSRDNDGRGIHFLRTYLQMQYPNVFEVDQMAQSTNQPYPNDLIPNPWV